MYLFILRPNTLLVLLRLSKGCSLHYFWIEDHQIEPVIPIGADDETISVSHTYGRKYGLRSCFTISPQLF